MRNTLQYLLILILITLPAIPALSQDEGPPPQPKHEFRSVWLTTAGGLDWPTLTHGPTQRSILRSILQRTKDLGMNAIVFQVVPRGDAYYQSERLPWARRLTGTMGQDPGYDPLQFLIDESRLLGLEVHAWYNVFRIGDTTSGDVVEADEGPQHIFFSNPELTITTGNEIWLNPGIPEARQWAVDNLIELVSNYDIDAVHFDYIRYSNGGFATDTNTRNEFEPGYSGTLADWRRDNVTRFVQAAHDSVKKIKPWVKVGSTPVGHYQTSGGWAAFFGYSAAFQDSRRWLREGINDYIVPQIYWDIAGGDAPQFDWLVRDWMGETYGRHVYIGTAVYNPNVRPEIPRQIDTVRANNGMGQVHFRYNNVNVSPPFGNRYNTPAIVPPMPWLDMNKPGMPVNLTVNTSGTSVVLAWDHPVYGRGVPEAMRYAVYRVPKAGNGIASDGLESVEYLMTVTGATGFTDSSVQEPDNYDYYITSLSRNNVESEAAWSGTATSAGREEQLAREFRLDQNYPNPFNPVTNIRFSLDEPGLVSITVYDLLGRVVARPLHENRAAGAHSVSFEASHLSSGVYLYRLESGNRQLTRKMMLIK
jgi:uncharacterized lipoprotein YddW (UPF0748 family)